MIHRTPNAMRPGPRPLHALVHLLLAGALLAACGEGGPNTTLRVERDTIGDTVIVRTVAGRAWDADAVLEPDLRIGTFEGAPETMLGDVAGLAVAPHGSIYLFDRQVPALRKYSATGEYLATFGREGGGPGEYKQGDGGLAVLPGGRVLLRDPGNARINVYSPSGEVLGGWDLRGGYFTSRPLYVDTAGIAYTQIWGSNEAGDRYTALQPFSPDGERLDSIMAPSWDFEPAGITFSGERVQMMNAVPFSPAPHWTFSPLGYYVGGLSTEYSIDVFRPDGTVLRIQRVTEHVRVDPAEKDARRMGITRNFQQLAPDWQWNGPAIPDAKPAFQDLAVGADGRLWVRLHQPGYLAEPADPEDPRSVDQWAEPVVWDIFEPDGTYLGQVRAPDGFRVHPQPVFGPDHVWAITTDDLDVQYLTRFEIRRPRTEPVSGEG